MITYPVLVVCPPPDESVATAVAPQNENSRTATAENIDELKKVLQLIWDQLPQDSINKAIFSFQKRLRACVKAGDGHFEHTLK